MEFADPLHFHVVLEFPDGHFDEARVDPHFLWDLAPRTPDPLSEWNKENQVGNPQPD